MTIGTSRIFRSTDSGAPQLTLTQGSFTAMLKAVLVDGYGSTSPLGFDQMFYASTKLVVRSKYGTRQFIRFYDENQLYTNVTAYDSMNTIDSGIGVMPDDPTNVQYIIHRSAVQAGNNPWIIIGDEIGFFILVRFAYSTSGALTNGISNLFCAGYIGDYIAYDVTNKWNFCSLCSNSNSSGSGNGFLINSGYLKRGHAKTIGNTVARFIPMYNTSYIGNNNYLLNYTDTGLSLINGVLLHQSVKLASYDSVAGVSIIIGQVPGLFDSMGKPASITYDGINPPPYNEWTDSNGILNIQLCIPSSGVSLASSSMIRPIIKVGGGFRNVQ